MALLSLSWSIALTSASAFAGMRDADRVAEVVNVIEPWIAAEMEMKGLPALSIALVDDQRIVWSRGFGFADRARQVPATADTLYRVGSISKLFTALAVMQLVEQGRLDLDEPVSRALPEFAPRNPFKTPVTLRHLLTHRAGVVREPPVGHYFDPMPHTILDVVKSLSETTLVYEPGTRTKYSNVGFTVAGAVVERIADKPFARAVQDAVLKPLGMTRSTFEPGPELARQLAYGVMWSYDGQTIETPTFLLGEAPAGNLVASAADLARFLSAIFAEGRAPGGAIVRPETLRTMLEPPAGGSSDTGTIGLGFALSSLDGSRLIGHNGAVYGFAAEVMALPQVKLGAVVITNVDCATGATRLVAETALRLLLAARGGRPLEPPLRSRPVPRERARQLAGSYHGARSIVDIVDRGGKVLLSRTPGLMAEIRAGAGGGSELLIDDRLISGPAVQVNDGTIRLGHDTYDKTSEAKPAAIPTRWEGLIGEYGWDHDVLYILEKHGQLHALIEWFFEYPLKELAPDRFLFPEDGLYAGESLTFTRDDHQAATAADVGGVVFKRRWLDGEGGKTFRIKPRRPMAEVHALADQAKPPLERGTFRKPDLVELIKLDPTIKLDIRYATTNNFVGVPFYTSARAFLERPAAEALLRAHRKLKTLGYGLLIHDGYRPWQVTKLFWEATPDSGRGFVADPAKGSKHNRGAAVDLTPLRAGLGQAREDGRRLRRILTAVVSRLPGGHVARALASRVVAQRDGSGGLHR